MKRVWNQIFSLLIILVFSATTGTVFGQGNKIDKTFNWTYMLKAEGTVVFNNYDCDLVIHTWDKEEVEYRMSVIATFPDNENATKVVEHLEDLDFSSIPSRVEIKNRFWTMRKNIAGRKTMKLDRSTTVRYKEFSMKGELWIPVGADLELLSKYSSIELENIDGKVNLDLYTDKVYCQEIKGDLVLKAKYSTIETKDIASIDANIYDCDVNTGNAGKSKYTSKYSNVKSSEVKNTDIDGYNDKFNFESTSDLTVKAKYTELYSSRSDKVTIDSYDGTFTIDNCENVDIISKYTKYHFKSAENCRVTSSYTDAITTDRINSLSIIESKYGKFTIGELDKSFTLTTGYNDKVIISNVNPEFTGISFNGKYLSSELGFNQDISYRLKANLKYPHLEIDEESYTVKVNIIESSQLEFEAVKGTETDNLPEVSVTGYDMRLKVVESSKEKN